MLHVLMAAVLIISVNFSLPTKKPKKTESLIHATVVSQKLFDDLAARKKQKALKKQRIKEQIKKEKERLIRKKALKKKKKAQRIKARKLLAAKRAKAKKDAAIAKKKAQEKAREDAKLSAQKEAQRKHQAKLDKLMEDTFNKSFSSAQSTKELSEISRYKALIKDKISRNWQVDSSMKNKSCTLAIRLSADGLVLSATRSKGDPEVCDSAKRATFKAYTLPIPKDPKISQQFLDFDITLEPNL